jgi:hypothetical protein
LNLSVLYPAQRLLHARRIFAVAVEAKVSRFLIFRNHHHVQSKTKLCKEKKLGVKNWPVPKSTKSLNRSVFGINPKRRVIGNRSK